MHCHWPSVWYDDPGKGVIVFVTEQTEHVLAEALHLPPVERAELIERLLASFEFPDRAEIDSLWAQEAEERIDAYERGEIPATPASEVFDRIDKGLRR